MYVVNILWDFDVIFRYLQLLLYAYCKYFLSAFISCATLLIRSERIVDVEIRK